MKINVTKTASQNLLDLISVSTGVTMSDQKITVGAATPYNDPNGVYNAQVTVTSIKNKGYRGAVTIRYKRLLFDQVFPTMATSWPILPTDTVSGVTNAVMQQMSALGSEFMLNSNAALTLPNANTPSVDVPITVVSNSKICLPSTVRQLKLVYSPPVVNVTYSASGNNLNTLTMLGNPTAIAHYVLTITGTIGSASTATPALTVGVLPAGCMLTIINKGTIQGAGGAGGAYNANGLPGGNAIQALMNFTLDTSAGKVFGGGGGGAGGYQTWALLNVNHLRSAGGGGCGTVVGAVGTGTALAGLGLQTNNAATAGTVTTGGVGAKTSSMSDATQYSQGGAGGGPGTAGGNSVVAKGTTTDALVFLFTGGSAGKAIDLNSKTVTISAGNNSTQIKGLVS